MIPRRPVIACLIVLSIAIRLDGAQAQPSYWFKKVLITNDDGIGDKNMQALARAFAKVAKTVVVAPLANSSGSSHYTSFWGKTS
jgi:hypothetical protein